jgi:hypothetical protein
MQTQDTAPTKQCKDCGGTFPLLMFHKQKGMKDGRRSYCKSCDRIRNKEWVARNKANGVPRWNKRLRGFIMAIKGQSACVVCGENEPHCLDFHHIDPKDKIGGIADLKTVQAIAIEVPKCVVLCANCHRKVHANLLDIQGYAPVPGEIIDEALREFGRDYLLGIGVDE